LEIGYPFIHVDFNENTNTNLVCYLFCPC